MPGAVAAYGKITGPSRWRPARGRGRWRRQAARNGRPSRRGSRVGLDRDYPDIVAFDTIQDARDVIAQAFVDYNTVKPKKRLGWLTPDEYRRKSQTRAD